MTAITSYTASRMKAIEDNAIVGGSVAGDNLILTRNNGVQVNAGNVRGPQGAVSAVAQEGWHTVGSGGEPAFQNSWAAGTVPVPKFRKVPDGTVEIRGEFTTGANGTTAFTLPTGYRPDADELYPIVLAGAVSGGYVRVNADGTVQITRATAASAYIHVTFPASGTPGGSFPAGAVQPIPVVSALPASPVDGQEVYYLADPATSTMGGPYIWHLRYRSSSTSTYKWDVLSSVPLYKNSAATNNVNSGAIGDGGTVLSVAAPLAGEYEVKAEMNFTFTGGGPSNFVIAAAFGASRTIQKQSATTVVYPNFIAYNTALQSVTVRRAMAAGEVVYHQHGQQANTAASGTMADRALTVTPIRVG